MDDITSSPRPSKKECVLEKIGTNGSEMRHDLQDSELEDLGVLGNFFRYLKNNFKC